MIFFFKNIFILIYFFEFYYPMLYIDLRILQMQKCSTNLWRNRVNELNLYRDFNELFFYLP